MRIKEYSIPNENNEMGRKMEQIRFLPSVRIPSLPPWVFLASGPVFKTGSSVVGKYSKF
jgi:hypothetical protein